MSFWIHNYKTPYLLKVKGGYLSVSPISQQFTRKFQRITPTCKANKPRGYLPVIITKIYPTKAINNAIIFKKYRTI